MLQPRIISTDVLVVGGGVAGLSAAVHAHRKGVKVHVLIKGPTCSSGLLGFNVAFRNARSGDTPAQFFNDLMTAGGYLNDERLIAIMAHESEPVLLELEKIGVPFQKENGQFAVRQAAGSSFPRCVYYADLIGTKIMNQLTGILTESGVNIQRGAAAFSLLRYRGRVVGALAVEKHQILAVIAKATILSTGGAGNLYAFTTNPPSVTGDGYAMAFEAGAELMDMEFVQFEPTVLVHPPALKGFNIPTSSIWDGAKIINSKVVEFLPKEANGKVKLLTKDVLSRLILSEITQGSGTVNEGVYMDWTVLPSEVINGYPQFVQTCQKAGIDPHTMRMEIAPAYHHMMGGVVIDSNCHTTVSGLFAAGEVAGGVHGANRLAGAAGTDALVFGKIAGLSAAEYIKKIAIPKGEAESAVSSALRRLNLCFGKEEKQKEKGETILSKLQKTMWEKVGIIRDATSMRRAIEQISLLREMALRSKADKIEDLVRVMEMRNACLVASMITQAALLRQESRGDHYRKDFPERDDLHWLKHIIFQHGGGDEPNIIFKERQWINLKKEVHYV